VHQKVHQLSSLTIKKSFELKAQKQLTKERDVLITITNNYKRLEEEKSK